MTPKNVLIAGAAGTALAKALSSDGWRASPGRFDAEGVAARQNSNAGA